MSAAIRSVAASGSRHYDDSISTDTEDESQAQQGEAKGKGRQAVGPKAASSYCSFS